MSFQPHYIIQNKSDERAWLSVPETAELTLEDAVEKIEEKRKDEAVLSAWVTETDNPLPVYFKCYVNIAGRIWPE